MGIPNPMRTMQLMPVYLQTYIRRIRFSWQVLIHVGSQSVNRWAKRLLAV